MCTNSEIDEQLKELAVAAQQHQPKTLERQQAVTELVKEIQKHNIVRPPKNQKFSRQIYEEIRAEAEQDLMLRICKEIHNYRPEKEVRHWVNFLLEKCFQAATPKVIGNKQIKSCFGDLVAMQKPVEDDSDERGTALREMIEEDAGDVFKSETMQNYPHINFQMLLLKRLDDVGWQKMSEEFRVKLPTLNAFFQRRLQKFTPRFREYL